MEEKGYHVLGKDFPRKDGVARVTGKEIYPSDIFLEGMLHGQTLRSPHPHARVKDIDFSEAEKIGAVCLSFQDVPKTHFNARQVSIPRNTFKDWQVLTDHVRQIGDPFGAVAAETPEIAAKAAEAVQVEWEILPFYLTMDDALAAEENLIHDRIYLEDKEIVIQNNIACTREVVEGDAKEGFKQADVIVENEFVTSRVYHAQLEPKACVCRPETDGGVTVWPATQALHNTRILIGEIFNIPLNKVNVVRIAVGGHFGSGIHTNPVNLITVALAL
jgi:xanthine dehydrogenase molybdenum-binding subunit